MANGELIDAREAMEMLGIGENDLQTLVARGDLRAFRSAGTMKFRREDVLGMKKEKGTEPTIIIPAAGHRKPGQSGILSAVDAGPTGSGINRPASAPQHRAPDATDEIVFDDIELMPQDDGMQTQHATVVSSGIDAPVSGEQTVVDAASGTGEHTLVEGEGGMITGEQTLVESDTGNQAEVSTGPAQPITLPAGRGPGGSRPRQGVQSGSRVQPAMPQGPAVSRVRQQSVATARRTATVYEKKSAHPIMTSFLLINTGVMLFTFSIFIVMVFKGNYDWDPLTQKGSKERILPPYLTKKSPDGGSGGLGVYEGSYDGYGSFFGALPGHPADVKPPNEPDPPKDQAAQQGGNE